MFALFQRTVRQTGLLAAQILGLSDKSIQNCLVAWRAAQTEAVADSPSDSELQG